MTKRMKDYQRLDDSVNSEPEKWNAGLPKGLVTPRAYSAALSQKLKRAGREWLIPIFEEQFGQKLYGNYIEGLSLKDKKLAFANLKIAQIKAGEIKIPKPEKLIAVPKRRNRQARKTSGYSREGKTVKGFVSHVLNWTPLEESFVKSRKGLPLKELTKELNSFFNVNRSPISIRDKRARLEGRKK